MSVVVAILWGILIVADTFWGFSGIRYPNYLTVHSDSADAILLVLIAIAIGLSYSVVYRLGEIRGVAEMKNTNLFTSAIKRRQKA
jgi:uncharacterized membrane protein YwzB